MPEHPAPFVIDRTGKIIDVGTGAGFPGIPVKIACPDVEMTLLDSLQKRIGFLEEVGSQLHLSGVHYVHSRAEDGGQNPDYREQFDLCVSRAVANLAVLAEFCLPFVKVGGRLAALKGPDALREIDEAQGALKNWVAKWQKSLMWKSLSQTYSISWSSSKRPRLHPRHTPEKQGKSIKIH